MLGEFLSFVLVSGGANGADSFAEKFAGENDLGKVIIKPDRKRYGRAAGPIRNRQIVEEADQLVAFWDGRTPRDRIKDAV